MAIFLSRGQKMEGGRQKMTNWRFLALPSLAWTDFWGPPENPGGPTENGGFQFFGLREKNGRTFFVGFTKYLLFCVFGEPTIN